MPRRYNVMTQNNNKVLNDLKKLDGFASELENMIGNGSASDGITASDIANYLLQLGVKTRQHDVDIADRVSKSALAENGLLNTVNKTIGGSSNEIGDAELAQYLKRNTEIVNDHTYYLDNSAVSKEKFRSLTAGFTEFKKVEFNLPVTPAPNTAIFTPPPVNSGYIQVRNKDSITVNALVSMFNKGVINNSWNVNFINAPDDNGFVRNVDNTLTGMDSMATPNSTRHLMCVKPESNFTLKMSFMVNNADDFSDFFMYSILANPNETGAPFSAKVLDVNSVMSNQSYVSKTLDDPRNTLFDGSANVFYNLKINKTGNGITFTITTEDGVYIGSGSDTVSASGIKWGLLNNKNVSVKSIVMDGVTWYIGNGEDLTDDFGAYKIQAAINNNDFIVTYFVAEGSFWEVMSINGPIVESKMKSQYGTVTGQFASHLPQPETSADLEFVHSVNDTGSHLLYDLSPTRVNGDGLLIPTQYDLDAAFASIPKTNETDVAEVRSISTYLEGDNTIVLLQGVVVKLNPDNFYPSGYNAVFTVKITIETASRAFVSAGIINEKQITMPSGFAFDDDDLEPFVGQATRNDPIDDPNDRDSLYILTNGKKHNAETGNDETCIFIFHNNDLIAYIPVKDKLGQNPIQRSYLTDSGDRIQYLRLALLGSQLASEGGNTYMYVCYGTTRHPVQPYSNIIYSNTYQKLARINLSDVLEAYSNNTPVELNSDTLIQYFQEDPSQTREPQYYISPMASYPQGQHINISSNAMVCVNNRSHFMRKMSVYELDLDNLYFKNRVDYESSINYDRRPQGSYSGLLPYRLAVSKDFVNVIGSNNNLVAVNLESSFSKGAAVNLSDHLQPIEYLLEEPDLTAANSRVSQLDPIKIPLWYSFDKIIPLADANSTSLASAKPISATLAGGLVVDGESYSYDFDTQTYISTSDTTHYYTVSVETGSFEWNNNVVINTTYKIMQASTALGGKKWLAIYNLDPEWVYQKYAIEIDNYFVTVGYYPDISHETPVPGQPTLVYLGLGTAIAFTVGYGNGREALGTGFYGWQNGYGIVDLLPS